MIGYKLMIIEIGYMEFYYIYFQAFTYAFHTFTYFCIPVKHFYVEERKYITTFAITNPHFEIVFSFFVFFS